MTAGLNNGILALLAVIAVVQGGFVALFVSFWQRARRLRRRQTALQMIQGGAG
jgi:type II secretory pathway component PulK